MVISPQRPSTAEFSAEVSNSQNSGESVKASYYGLITSTVKEQMSENAIEYGPIK